MKIGLDGRFWSAEAAGLARYSKELVNNLLKIDKENEYFLFLLPEHFAKFKSSYKNLKPIQVSSKHYTIKEQIKLPFEMNKVKLDFMHFLSFNHPVFWPGKFIITIHDLTLFFYPSKRGKTIVQMWAMKGVMKDAAERALKIIVPSESTKKDLVNNFNIEPEKVFVTYEGVPKEFKPLSNSKINQFKKTHKLEKPFLLYLGQHRPHKNLEKLIKAFEIAKKNSGLDFQLVIGGKPDPNYKTLNDKIQNSDYSKDIICPGFIKEKDIISWYNSATAFIFPSLYEGFGLPPLEAMACGTPVLSSNTSSMPEVLGNAAIYFNPSNVNEMSDKIIEIIKKPELQNEMAEKGLQQVKKFSFQKMAEETLKVYNSVL
jgi:glycosyltransferase involved in cell wall biosynthesis